MRNIYCFGDIYVHADICYIRVSAYTGNGDSHERWHFLRSKSKGILKGLKMKRATTVVFFVVLMGWMMALTTSAAPADTSHGAAAIKKAAKANKYLFIFFWKDDAQRTSAARGVFQSAMTKIADAESVEIKTTDPAEQQIATRYGVDRAPMPFVLAIAPNGAMTKGFPTQFDEKQLRQAFVSPCTAECMKALQDRNLVLLCVEPSASKIKQVSLQKGVQDFTEDEEYTKNSKVVAVNAGDPAEAAFLRDLRVDPKTPDRVTVLMAPPAAVVGTFVGNVTKDELTAKLKSAQSGCCPGGSCCPKK